MRPSTDEDIEEKVHRIFRDKLHLAASLDTDVMAEGILDSLSLVQLITEIEEEFGITVEVTSMSLDDFRSIRRISSFVEARLDER